MFEASKTISRYDGSAISSRMALKHASSSPISNCLHIAPRAKLKWLAVGIALCAVHDKFAVAQILDAHSVTTDGREPILTCYTEPGAIGRCCLPR